MTELTPKERALTENYSAFQKMLPDLLEDDKGKFALIRHGSVSALFESAGEAHSVGRESFDDGLFSVQKVEESSLNLGFFSYARYCRAA